MEFFKVFTVGSRTHIVAIYPRSGHKLYEILVSVVVFGKYNKVVATHVAFLLNLVFLATVGYIHISAEYGFEWFLAVFLEFPVHFIAVVEQLFHAKHIAVVGNSHAFHSVGDSLIDEFLDRRLSVKD